MKIPKPIFIFIIIILSIIHLVNASSSPEYLNHVSNIIFNDCDGQEIVLKYPLTSGNGIQQSNFSSYNLNNLLSIISVLDKYSYSLCHMRNGGGTCESAPGDLDGLGILKCGVNVLDISGYDYIWNGNKIPEPSSITYNQWSNCTLNLNKTIINYNQLQKQDFWKTYIYPIISSLILSFISYLMIYKTSKYGKKLWTYIVLGIIFLIVSYLIMFIISKFV